MSRALLASTAAILLSATSTLAGGLQPPIQPVGVAPASFAFADRCPVVDGAIRSLQAQGFTSFAVDTGPTQARVTAMRGDLMNELVYDCRTSQLLAQGAERVSDRHSPGVVMVRGEDDNDFVLGAAEGRELDLAGEADLGSAGGDISGATTGQPQVEADQERDPGDADGDGDVDRDDDRDGDGDIDDEDRADGSSQGGERGLGLGRDNDRGGCGDDDPTDGGTENGGGDNCGLGNNDGGIDPDNPAHGDSPAPGQADRAEDDGRGPGNGGTGGQGNVSGG